jgi:hypothetical protein
MAVTASDTFDQVAVDTDELLSGHTPTGGGTWTDHATFCQSALRIRNDQCKNIANGHVNAAYHSTDPTNADYSVFMDVILKTDNNDAELGPAGRMATGANTAYWVQYHTGSNAWVLRKCLANSYSNLDTEAATLTPDQAYEVELRMSGTSISGYIDGVLTLGPVTDSDIAAKGKAGIWAYGTCGDTTGLRGDDWALEDPSAGGGGGSVPIFYHHLQQQGVS